MFSTPEEIVDVITENLEWLKAHEQPDELLREIAESLIPIYNSEIISDWAEMPQEFENFWAQFGWDEFLEQGGIIGLMRIDLENYYQVKTVEAYEQITGKTLYV